MIDYFENTAKRAILQEIAKYPQLKDLELLRIINSVCPFSEEINLPKIKHVAWLKAKKEIILDMVKQGRLKPEFSPITEKPDNRLF